jgi:PAS domain S-box-containing protein
MKWLKPDEGRNSPVDWRANLLKLMLRVTVGLGTLVYVPSVWASLHFGVPGVAWVDTVALAGIIGLLLADRLSFRWRASLFCTAFYVIAVGLLVGVGAISQIYLFAFSILTTLLLGLRAGIGASLLSAVTLFAIGALGWAVPETVAAPAGSALSGWAVVTLNFTLVNTLLALALGLVLDERKRSEAALRHSEEQLRLITNLVPHGIFAKDAAGRHIFANPALAELAGLPVADILGKTDFELVADRAEAEAYRADDLAVIQSGQKKVIAEESRTDLSGRTRILQTIKVPFTLIETGEAAVLGVCMDITERKKLEQQFLRAQRMESIGTLAGGIAHDLNNILAPIMMSIGVLQTLSDHPDARTILQTIETSAKRGADIVRQVLSFARGLEGQRVEIQPRNLLKDLENIIKETFPKDVQLAFSVPGDPWTIWGDPTQVHQILLNLCVNARDAMPAGGRLTVEVENCELDEHFAAMNAPARPGRYVKISVTDSGTGIPAEIINKIFEPFFTTKEVNKGTGLGLSTVMAIVKSHEGVVNVYSEPGKGTTFKVYLPAADAGREASHGQREQPSLPRGNGETILVIDDEASVRTVTGQTLEAFGYRALTARDGAEGVAIYAEHKDRIAVVLTDMMMPVMDGLNVARVLNRINPRIKLIAASGLVANGTRNGLAEAGVRHFLAKPYSAETLLKTLSAILAEP